MNKPKYIETWEELSKVKSPTHNIDIDVEGCSGWVFSKDGSNALDGDWYYLSTHAFYGGQHKGSTMKLQEYGFNVELANWDEEE